MKTFGLIIHRIVLATTSHAERGKPFGFWIRRGMSSVRLRRDPALSVSSDSEFWRCVLNEVRMYFELNPDAE